MWINSVFSGLSETVGLSAHPYNRALIESGPAGGRCQAPAGADNFDWDADGGGTGGRLEAAVTVTRWSRMPVKPDTSELQIPSAEAMCTPSIVLPCELSRSMNSASVKCLNAMSE
jgi:hypothetical protein